ncbi:MAG: hypothetical protein SV775_11445 [Thermodesulfobacteriota bacterium]|nr:hypothetical protein [Thermodesulfobacteriota bacterium]
MERYRINYFFLIVSVIAVVCAVYWQSLFLSFIQDDWGLLRFLQENSSFTALDFFKYESTLFYRPLAQAYMFLMYKLFGPNPIPFHVAALFIHAINACLVALILNIIIRDRLISYLAALVYVAAIAIHLDPLAWMVGIYDVLGAFFFFMCMWLFLRNQPAISMIFYFLGCLVKESVVLIPVLLFSYPFIRHPTAKLKDQVLAYWKKTIPFLLAMGVVLTIRLSGNSPFELPAAHPYLFDLKGFHFIRNILIYPAWMLQSFFPFVSVKQPAFQFLTFLVGLVLSYGIFVTFRMRGEESNHRRVLFFFVWIIVGLLPALFLANHTYRYYCTYSLPAFIASFLLLFKCIFLSIDVRGKVISAILISISSLAVIGSISQGTKIYSEGLRQNTLSDGTNELIRRAAFVDIVRKGLTQDLPHPPSDSFIVIGNADLWSFNKNSGPQFWYNNGTISVYALSDLKYKDGQPYIHNPIESQLQSFTGSTNKKIFLDPSSLFVYQVSNGKLVRIDAQDLEESQRQSKP